MNNIQLTAQAIQNASSMVITAGAGMGVDSGLPDFREMKVLGLLSITVRSFFFNYGQSIGSKKILFRLGILWSQTGTSQRNNSYGFFDFWGIGQIVGLF